MSHSRLNQLFAALQGNVSDSKRSNGNDSSLNAITAKLSAIHLRQIIEAEYESKVVPTLKLSHPNSYSFAQEMKVYENWYQLLYNILDRTRSLLHSADWSIRVNGTIVLQEICNSAYIKLVSNVPIQSLPTTRSLSKASSNDSFFYLDFLSDYLPLEVIDFKNVIETGTNNNYFFMGTFKQHNSSYLMWFSYICF
jgi:hypothetical protein